MKSHSDKRLYPWVYLRDIQHSKYIKIWELPVWVWPWKLLPDTQTGNFVFAGVRFRNIEVARQAYRMFRDHGTLQRWVKDPDTGDIVLWFDSYRYDFPPPMPLPWRRYLENHAGNINFGRSGPMAWEKIRSDWKAEWQNWKRSMRKWKKNRHLSRNCGSRQKK